MRRIIGKLGLLAAAVTLLVGCAKDGGEKPQEVFERTVTVSLSKIPDTKTSVVEGADKAQFIWTDGDDNNFFVYENGVLGTVESVDFSEDMRKATLSVTFSTAAASEYVYTAKFADDFSNHGNPKLSASQYPSVTSYDPFADILVSDEIRTATAAASLQFVLNRKVAVNKMTVKGLTSGEEVLKVEIETDKVMAGSLQDNGSFDGTDKKIVLNYSGVDVASDGTFPVYFNCAPIENATIASIVVTTDKAVYTRNAASFSGKLTLPLGKMTRFNVDMTGCREEINSNVYTLVESTADLVEGKYIIVAEDYNFAMGTLNGKYHERAAVAKSSDKKTIELEDASGVVPFILKKNGSNWTFQNVKQGDACYGKYLAWNSSDGNSSTEQDSKYNWTITVNSSETVISSAATTTRMLQYNHSAQRFACYLSSSNQLPVLLYKNAGGGSTPDPDPSAPVISVSPKSLNVSAAGGTQSVEYIITNPATGVNLTAAANVSWISSISVSATSVSFFVAYNSPGSSSRTGALTLKYDGAEDVVVAVNQQAGEGGDQAANGWLELPASQTGADFFNGTFKASGARNYTYLYQYSTYTALWTAYPLYSATTKASSGAPSGVPEMDPDIVLPDVYSMASWGFNPQIDESKQVNLKKSYGVSVAGTIYSRGHQIPNGDRKGVSAMQSQTYYFTNSTPQIQNGFNGTIWSALENGIRGALGADTIYVVTGASFRKVGGNETIKYINPVGDPSKNVPVPNYYWKVLLKVKRSGGTVTSASAIGFWMEHKQYSGNDYVPYAETVDQIEAWTGFNFFVNLPESIQNAAESQTTGNKKNDWNVFKNF